MEISTSSDAQAVDMILSATIMFDRIKSTYVRIPCAPNCIKVHDHMIGVCSRCGSAPPKTYTGKPGNIKMKNSKWAGNMVGTRDKDCGMKLMRETLTSFKELKILTLTSESA